MQNPPDLTASFPPSRHRQALGRLSCVVQSDKGTGIFPGGIGCGKTGLTRAFILQVGKDKRGAVVVAKPSLLLPRPPDGINLQLGISASRSGWISCVPSTPVARGT